MKLLSARSISYLSFMVLSSHWVHGLISSLPDVDLVPSIIIATEITKHYPTTLVSKLFSSVPKRHNAIDHVTLKICGGGGGGGENNDQNGAILLLGNSSSGKSTLLRLLAGIEPVSSGSITITVQTNDEKNLGPLSCKPIIVDRKPDCFDRKRTVLERIQLSCSHAGSSHNNGFERILVENLAQQFAFTLGLTTTQIHTTPNQLSPSGQFMFGLACACMQSVQPCIESMTTSPCTPRQLSIPIPYPILFLDELFDFEHSDIPRKVAPGMVKLCNKGAIIVVATHKPHQMEEFSSRIIRMSAGRIIQDEYVLANK